MKTTKTSNRCSQLINHIDVYQNSRDKRLTYQNNTETFRFPTRYMVFDAARMSLRSSLETFIAIKII